MIDQPKSPTARRLRRATGVCALAVFGWAMAPAISAEPYLPPAEDFTQDVPAFERVEAAAVRTSGGHDGEGAVTHVSAVIEAPARFDLAGIAGETRPFELRGREGGGEWTDWVETASADPVWFGGADELQLRTRGWKPTGELHYVNVSGDATDAGGLLTAARETVNSAVLSAHSLIGAEIASGAPEQPAMVGRGAWGANRRRGGCPPRTNRPTLGAAKAVAVHHTVSATDYSASEAPGMVLGICRFHRNANGWNDIGYNALVDKYGTLYVGRAGGKRKAVVGAHAQGFNAQTTSIAALGTHTKKPLSSKAMRAAANYIAWKLVVHGLTANGRSTLVSAGGSASRYPSGKRVRTKRVIGHRRVGLTECPGNALNRQLETLRRKAQRRIDAAGGPKDPKGGGSSGGVGG